MVTIRDARPDEFELVGELTAIAYQPVLAFGVTDPYVDELRDAASRAENGQLLVFVSEANLILGTVTLARPGSAFAEIARPHELEVRMLAVNPVSQGRGVGKQLMGQVHGIAHTENFQAVALSVIGTNLNALSFYERMGYLRQPARDWYPVPDMPAPLKVLVKNLSQH